MNDARAVVVFAGAGGHLAQSQKFAAKLMEAISPDGVYEIVWMTDVSVGAKDGRLMQVGELRPKHRESFQRQLMMIFAHIIKSAKAVSTISKSRPQVFISFGPGSVILSSLFFRLRGVRIVHIESWSRFKTRSFTGIAMYRIADDFFVQNRSLLSHYPRAKWVGRLG